MRERGIPSGAELACRSGGWSGTSCARSRRSRSLLRTCCKWCERAGPVLLLAVQGETSGLEGAIDANHQTVNLLSTITEALELLPLPVAILLLVFVGITLGELTCRRR